MKRLLFALALLFGFSAMSFAKSNSVTLPGNDIKAKVKAAIAEKDKSLAGNDVLVNEVTRDVEKEIKKMKESGEKKVNFKKKYVVDDQNICIDITIIDYIYVEIGDDYIYIEEGTITIVEIYEC